MVKAIVDKIKNVELKADKLVKDAEASSQKRIEDFAKERAQRLDALAKENRALREKVITEAERKAKDKEADILSQTQDEINKIRAWADKRREDAVSLIVGKLVIK